MAYILQCGIRDCKCRTRKAVEEAGPRDLFLSNIWEGSTKSKRKFGHNSCPAADFRNAYLQNSEQSITNPLKHTMYSIHSVRTSQRTRCASDRSVGEHRTSKQRSLRQLHGAQQYTPTGTTQLLYACSKNCKARLPALSCLSVRPYGQLGSHWTHFHEVWYLSIFRNPVENIPVWLKSDKNNGYFTWRLMYTYGNISLSSSWNEKCFRQKL
jgi:hypothetical protein